jgi:hypothetical protein
VPLPALPSTHPAPLPGPVPYPVQCPVRVLLPGAPPRTEPPPGFPGALYCIHMSAREMLCLRVAGPFGWRSCRSRLGSVVSLCCCTRVLIPDRGAAGRPRGE